MPTPLERFGYWAWGTALVFATGFILYVLFKAAQCSVLGRDLATQLRGCKDEWWVGYYQVLKDWQNSFFLRRGLRVLRL
jgi:hypothetical protein